MLAWCKELSEFLNVLKCPNLISDIEMINIIEKIVREWKKILEKK